MFSCFLFLPHIKLSFSPHQTHWKPTSTASLRCASSRLRRRRGLQDGQRHGGRQWDGHQEPRMAGGEEREMVRHSLLVLFLCIIRLFFVLLLFGVKHHCVFCFVVFVMLTVKLLVVLLTVCFIVFVMFLRCLRGFCRSFVVRCCFKVFYVLLTFVLFCWAVLCHEASEGVLKRVLVILFHAFGNTAVT